MYLSAERWVGIDCKYSAGKTGTRFLTELRDNKRIMGTKCLECNRVYVPARPVCPSCLSTKQEWVEVGPNGTLETYTISIREESMRVFSMPGHIAFGIIKLDGADVGLIHYIAGCPFENLVNGMRVQAVFKEERKGSILDISHFRPVL